MSPENREFTKTPLMCKVEASFCETGQSIKDLLRQEYQENRQSTVEIGAAWGLSSRTVWKWMRRMSIKTRSISETWAQLSTEEKSARLENAHRGTMEAMQRKMATVLEGDPTQVLRDFTEDGFSASDIAAKTGEKACNIQHWLKKMGLKSQKRKQQGAGLSRKIIEDRQGLISRAVEEDVVKYLIPQDWLVLERRLGREGKTRKLEIVSSELGLTKERIRQREKQGVVVLEAILAGKYLPKEGEVVTLKKLAKRKMEGKSRLQEKLGDCPEETLSNWLKEERLTIGEVAVRLSCSYMTVRRIIRGYHIPLRQGRPRR